MAIEITSTTGNRSTTLWNAQEDQRQVQGGTRIDAPPLFTSDEVLLTQLESEEKFTLTGIATGNRLADEPDYSSNQLTALAEWTAEFEEYCNGQQGDGHTISLDHRGDLSIQGAVSSLGWERSEGAKYEVRWELEFLRGQALQSSVDTTIDSVSPSTEAYLDSTINLGEVESMRCEKKQQIRTYPIAFADPGENELLDKSGVIRRWTIIGTIENDTGDPDDERDELDADIRALVGQDTAVTFDEPFPGRSKTVMVDAYESTREAGVTRLGKYAIELIEGVTA